MLSADTRHTETGTVLCSSSSIVVRQIGLMWPDNVAAILAGLHMISETKGTKSCKQPTKPVRGFAKMLMLN